MTERPAAGAVGTPAGGDLGAAIVLAMALVFSIAVGAGLLNWALLQSPAWSGAVLVMALAVSTTMVLRLRPESGGHDRLAGLVLALPALGVSAVAGAGALRGAPDGIAWFLNGDHPRHVVYAADTWVQGNLSYTVEGYPHGWHSLLAAVWSLEGAGLDPASITRLLSVMAFCSLLLSALLALSTAHLGRDLAVRLGLSRWASMTIGLAAGAATLLNVFLANYQALGYENSLLAATVVAVCSREVLVRGGKVLSLAVCASGTVVLAHTWQLLLPVVAVAALWCGREAVRERGNRGMIAVVVLAVAALTLGAPAVLAVVQGVGIDHATETGPDSPVPLVLLGLGLASCVALAVREHDPQVRCVAVLAVIPSLLAVMLSIGLGVALLHYYPSKLLWQSALLGLSPLAAASAVLADRLLARGTGARIVASRVGTVVVAVCVAYGLLLPWGSQAGAWTTVDASRVLTALSSARAPESTVVWLGGNPTTDSVTRILLDTFRVEATRERAPQARLSVAQECELLEQAKAPVVLSTEPEQRVRERYACVPGLTAVRVG
ncbi:hypothetical protein ACOCJ4_12760 [Knoellia sp. CPCC 206435]|uniref:hypothetical protein n=1 Tax=Knoellia terrae TaxID=3404797 RepID=UPI003B42C0E0